MRKLHLLLFLAVMFSMTSCYNTFNTTKKATYDRAIDSVRLQLSNQGFAYVGKRYSTNVVASNRERPGDIITSVQKETYRFADDSGKTMSYSVSYGKGLSNKGVVFVNDVELCECETSDPNDFESLCGDDAFVNQLSNLPKDQKVQRINFFWSIFFTVNGVVAAALLGVLMAGGFK